MDWIPLPRCYEEMIVMYRNPSQLRRYSNGREKEEFNSKEMGALRVIIKCIEEYKLQEEYPVEPLKQRVAQLEKAKYDKKRTGQKQAAKYQQGKKPRANTVHASKKPPVPASAPAIYNGRGTYPNFSERYPESYAYAPYSAQRPPYPYGMPNYVATNYETYTGAAPNYGGYTGGQPTHQSYMQ